MTKVSVIIPVYGVEKYIERCARSLFEQTLNDIEFIFVNDCTPDKSIDILERVLKDYDSRINQTKIIHHRINKGLPQARKTGLQYVTGEYVIHCDSDDWVDVSMYKKMYDKAIQYNSDLVICDYTISDGNKRTEKVFEKDVSDCSREVVFQRLLTSSDLNPVWSSMAKQELYEDMMFPVGAMSEDKTIMIQLAWKAKNITYLPEALYYYFMSDTSIVRTRNIESNLYKFEQSMGNRSVILDFIKREKIEIPRKQKVAFLFSPKIGLIEDYLQDKECRDQWINTYPLSTWDVIVNKYISTKDKVKYLACNFCALLYSKFQR